MNGNFSLGQIQEREPNTNGAGEDDTFPIYYAEDTDPSYAVTCDKWGGCSGFMPSLIHIPNGARGSIDVDHHATVIELPEDIEIDFFQFNDGGTGVGNHNAVSGGGSLSAAFASVCRATSLANMGRCQGSAIAATIPVQPGILDAREILADIDGRDPIDHVIYVAVGCPSSQYVWPAAKSDGRCSQGPGEGQIIWLDLTDAKIDALRPPVYAWEKPILHAMHDYGLMIVDSACASACSPPWSFYGMDDESFMRLGMPPPWTAFFSEVAAEGDGKLFQWGDNASHLPLSFSSSQIQESNIHILDTGRLQVRPR